MGDYKICECCEMDIATDVLTLKDSFMCPNQGILNVCEGCYWQELNVTEGIYKEEDV